MANLKITLIKSPISSLKDQQDTVKALGLHKVYQTVEKPVNSARLPDSLKEKTISTRMGM